MGLVIWTVTDLMVKLVKPKFHSWPLCAEVVGEFFIDVSFVVVEDAGILVVVLKVVVVVEVVLVVFVDVVEVKVCSSFNNCCGGFSSCCGGCGDFSSCCGCCSHSP